MSADQGEILVGVDGSTSSTEAFAWALEQARVEHCGVALVHAVHPATPVWLDPTADEPREGRDLSLRSAGAEVLRAVHESVGDLAGDAPIRDVVQIGDARKILIELSQAASMLVLGSRGRGQLQSLLLGSTSVALVRHARCPVVVHRPAPPGRARHGIAVGVDGSADASTVLELAFRQASLRAEPLTVVHARHFPPSMAADGPFGEPSWAEDEPGAAIERSIANLSSKYPDVRIEVQATEGSPERSLLELADRASLLVVGVHHRSRAASISFGSMAVWLVEHAGCPVAAVPLAPDWTA